MSKINTFFVSSATIGAFLLIFLSFIGIENLEKLKNFGDDTFYISYKYDGEAYMDNKKVYKSVFYLENSVSKNKINTSHNKIQPYINLNTSEIKNIMLEKSNENVLINLYQKETKLYIQINSLKKDEWFNIIILTDKKLNLEDIRFIADLGNFKVDSNIRSTNENSYLKWLCMIISFIFIGLYFYFKKKLENSQDVLHKLVLDKNELLKSKNEEKEKLDTQIKFFQEDNYKLIAENKVVQIAFKELLKFKLKEDN